MRVRVGRESYQRLKAVVERVLPAPMTEESVGFSRQKALDRENAEKFPTRASKGSTGRRDSVSGHVLEGTDDIECDAETVGLTRHLCSVRSTCRIGALDTHHGDGTLAAQRQSLMASESHTKE